MCGEFEGLKNLKGPLFDPNFSKESYRKPSSCEGRGRFFHVFFFHGKIKIFFVRRIRSSGCFLSDRFQGLGDYGSFLTIGVDWSKENSCGEFYKTVESNRTSFFNV